MSLTQSIKQKAIELGFDLVGFTSAKPHADFSFYEKWIEKKSHGTMEWLVRGSEKRGDPQKILPGVKTIISCGLNYYRGYPKSTESEKKDHVWVSNYAWGEDYHDIVLEKLEALILFINEISEGNAMNRVSTKAYVDTGPILERSYAQSAGLGWVGKNTCLINTKIGSYFFIGEILTTLELETDQPGVDHCGKCTRCIDACPTDALTAYELDANKCLSYLTIEHKGEISEELKSKMGQQFYGCDICQDVCPWNKKNPLSTEKKFDPQEGNFHPEKEQLKKLTKEDFSKKFKNSPIKRMKWEKWQQLLYHTAP